MVSNEDWVVTNAAVGCAFGVFFVISTGRTVLDVIQFGAGRVICGGNVRSILSVLFPLSFAAHFFGYFLFGVVVLRLSPFNATVVSRGSFLCHGLPGYVFNVILSLLFWFWYSRMVPPVFKDWMRPLLSTSVRRRLRICTAHGRLLSAAQYGGTCFWSFSI